MRVIRPGYDGDDVTALQLFLCGQGMTQLVPDGIYAPAWVRVVRAFQAAHGLKDDGVVGPRTFGLAQALGYNPGFLDTDTDELGPNFPPKPDFVPLTQQGLAGFFETFAYEPVDDPARPGAIRILGDWVEKHIVEAEVPQLADVEGAPKHGRIRLHQRAVAPYQAFFAKLEAAGLCDRILSFGGSFCPRFIRGSNAQLSVHAYGGAIDLNVRWNLLKTVPALKGHLGSVRELVPLANACGIFWGGHFSRLDGMHFELAK
jgi:hypothetical protein